MKLTVSAPPPVTLFLFLKPSRQQARYTLSLKLFKDKLMDKITNDARVYTDVQGLDKLRAQYKSDPEGVKKEVSQQFEALFVQMVLRSMRDANEAYSSGLFSSNDMSLFQDMFDKQLSLSFSGRGLGLAKMIEDNIDQQIGAPSRAEANLARITTENTPAVNPIKTAAIQPRTVGPAHTPPQPAPPSTFNSPKEFLQSLWGHAKQAAGLIGVHPAVILAQAALETDWGKKVIAHAKGTSHNLFNIKADPSWHKDTTTTATLEQKGGIIVREKANFKSYDSYQESFMDYAHLISSNPRYQKAVANAAQPQAYTTALQEAGYATDEKYASKIMEIMKSPQFQTTVAELNKI
jgi:flagellar protein FlgJ